MIRTIEEDFGIRYDPEVHRDVADVSGWYLEQSRRALFVAVDDATRNVVATGAVRGGALQGGPPELVQRYDDERTAQLVRIYTLREYRRRGVGHEMVRAALAFILADGAYDTIALHTFPHSPGALAFWESIGTRCGESVHAGALPEIFFEISLGMARELVDEPT